MQFSKYNTTFFDYMTFFLFSQELVITEVLVCPIYALHEFIVLDNNVWFFYFQVSFSVFPSCVSPLLCHGSYLSFAQVFCPFTLGPSCHLTLEMQTALFASVCLPTLVHVECLLALTVPQTLTSLSSSFSANFTLL